jgi:hypothetical protein
MRRSPRTNILQRFCEHIKAEQDKALSNKRRAGKQFYRYQPNGKRNNGWNSKLAKRAKEKAKTPASHAAEATARMAVQRYMRAPPSPHATTPPSVTLLLYLTEADILTWL